jgi:hypothetical protein
MPGVAVTVGAVSGPSAPTLAPSSKYFAVGLAERGSTTEPTRVTSFAQFQELFGARTTYSALWDDMKTFFEEGGTEAYAARVVGPAATIGTLTGGLMDGQATPATTLTVSARSAGAWSSGLTVQVLAGPTADTFRIVVRLAGVVVHDWTNLHNPAEAVSKASTSPYIKFTDAGSAGVAPQNNPAVVAATALGAGTDDRASVTASHYVTALALFTTELGDGAVAIPGIGTTVHAGLIAHADATNKLALLAAASTTDKATLISTAAALDAKRAGLFAPWIKVPDEYGGTRTISPEGYVAAARARAHAVGPWKAAAGDGSSARYVVGPATVFSGVDGEDLDSAKVNVIRTVARSTRLYGWVSLAADRDNWGFLTGADTVNRVVTEAYRQLEPYLFGVIDARGHLLGQIHGTLEGIVIPMAEANGLYARLDPADPTGPPLDPGYRVRVLDINPVEVSALNKVLAELGIRVSPTAAIVQLTVTKAAVTAAL